MPRLWWCLLLSVPVRAPAQSLIGSPWMDHHWIHAATKPVVSLGAYAGLRLFNVPKPVATVLAILGPSALSNVVWEVKIPGHWRDPLTLKDDLADSWAASLSLIVLRMRGWRRIVAAIVWSAVEFGGLNKWARP